MNRFGWHFAGIFLIGVVPVAQAATFAVTRTDDPLPNGCAVNNCSLREAVLAANANTDADLIQVPAGQYGLPRGKLVISANVQIYGSAAATTNIEGDGEYPVFDINGVPSVTLASLSIKARGYRSFLPRRLGDYRFRDTCTTGGANRGTCC